MSSPDASHGEAAPRSGETIGLKRRQSEVSEQDTKRQRTSPGKTSPPATETITRSATSDKEFDSSTTPAPSTEERSQQRKRNGVADEKQRSKRLFGALLGNLKQTEDRTSRRRAEIEQRRKAELQKQDDERLEDRQRRLERLDIHRKKEQIRLDEEHMRSRHENLINTANFLQTRTQPMLCYRPWDLLPDEEDRLDDQAREAEETVDKELASFAEEKRRRLAELEASENDNHARDSSGGDIVTADRVSEEKTTEEQDEVPKIESLPQVSTKCADPEDFSKTVEIPDADPTVAHEPDVSDHTKETKQALETTPGKPDQEKGEDAEDEGYHVVEGDEDTVVY